MMRRLGAITLATALVGGLFAIPAAPAGAQNGDSMLDAPRLGFEIDPQAGNVGDTVAAQVDPGDVQEKCLTEVSEISGLFFDAEHPNANSNRVYRTPAPVFADFMNLGPLIGVEVPDEWPVQDPFPGLIPATVLSPPAGVDPLAWTWNLLQPGTNITTPNPPASEYYKDTPEKVAAAVMWLFMNSFLGDPAPGGIVGQAKAQLLEASTIVTFVDPVSQELVGELGGFDADTGTGSVEVPDVAPGLWAVVAACVEPVVTEESFMAAIQTGADLVADRSVSVPMANSVLQNMPNEDFEDIAVAMLIELMAPRALGIEFYCILNDDGFCATPPDPVGLLAELSDEELAEFADLETGDSAGDGDAGPDESAVEPVSASPAFTG